MQKNDTNWKILVVERKWCYRAQLSYSVVKRTYEAYGICFAIIIIFVIWRDVNEQHVLLYNAHLGLMKVSLQKDTWLHLFSNAIYEVRI